MAEHGTERPKEAVFQFETETGTFFKKPATLPPPIRYTGNRDTKTPAIIAGVFIFELKRAGHPTGAIARRAMGEVEGAAVFCRECL
jgi:hypothetical protein